jgi:hypothetical protein
MRFRPARLAAYIAPSARANKLSGVSIVAASAPPNFRLGHQDPYSLGRFSQAGIVGGFDQHRKLFASPASHDVARSDRALESGSDRLQHRIAGGVAMQVVDLLEVVDVDYEQPEVPAVTAEVLETATERRIEHAPVRQTRQLVGQRVPTRSVRIFHGLDHSRSVGEDLDAADDRARRVANRSGPKAHGFSIATEVTEPHRDLSGLAVEHRCRQGAQRMAQRAPLVVHMSQDVVVTVPAHYLRGGIPGDPLGAEVPVSERPLGIDVVDAVGHVVDDYFVQVGAERVRRDRHGRSVVGRGDRRRRGTASIASSMDARDAGVHVVTLAPRTNRVLRSPTDGPGLSGGGASMVPRLGAAIAHANGSSS